MRVLVLLAVIGISSAIPVFDDQILLAVPRLKSSHDSLNSHPSEWIQGPDSNLYQFHVGKQTWLAAREYCLARNSDLIHLKDKKQLDWVLEHYSPIDSGVERVLQVGVLKSKQEWKWVDGSELKSDVVDWKEGETSDETCALLQLNDTRLIRNACDETVLARFVCQRTNAAHEKQQRSDNFFWSRLETLFDYFGIGKGSVSSTAKPVPDYYDEDNGNDKTSESLKEVNITSAERLELASIRTSSKPLTSSEEEDQVDKVLEQLTKIPSVLPEKPKSPTRSSEEDNEEQIEDFHDFKAHRSPAKSLKELSEVEGSGQLVDKYEITTEEAITVEDPHKLQNIIDNMEKMLADIEKIKVPGDGKVTLDEETSQTSNPEDNLLTTDSREVTKSGEQASIQATTLVPKVSEESLEKQKSGEIEEQKESSGDKPRLSGVKNNAISDDLEEDFDSEKEKSMPVADIKPKEDDEDCDEKTGEDVEGSGEASSNLQKPSIPKDREEHIRKFLKTLRVFLARASHDDLRKVLDDKNQKSLLERMEGVIKLANAREFARLDNAQNGDLLPQQDDTSVMMDEKEQEDLFKRISDVVLQQAQKEGIILTATEPSVRTTTEEIKTQKSKEEKKDNDKNEKGKSTDSESESTEEEKKTSVSEEESSVEVVVKKKQRKVKQESSESSEQQQRVHNSPPAQKKAALARSKFSKVQSTPTVSIKTKRSPQTLNPKYRTNRKLRRQIKSLMRERQAKTKQLVHSRSTFESKKIKSDLNDLDGILNRKRHLRQQRLIRRQRRRGDIGKRQFKRKLRRASVKRARETRRLHNNRISNSVQTNTEAHSTKATKPTKSPTTTTTTTTTTTPRATTTTTHKTTTAAHKKPKARQHRQEKKDKDERNPLGLPKSGVTTLAPLPTFAPLPSLQEVFEKWDKSFRDLFKPLPTIAPPKF